jgi:hypothetical protein
LDNTFHINCYSKYTNKNITVSRCFQLVYLLISAVYYTCSFQINLTKHDSLVFVTLYIRYIEKCQTIYYWLFLIFITNCRKICFHCSLNLRLVRYDAYPLVATLGFSRNQFRRNGTVKIIKPKSNEFILVTSNLSEYISFTNSEPSESN